MAPDGLRRRTLRALDEYWTPPALTPRMRQELRRVANNDDVAARLLREYDTTRHQAATRQRWLFIVYSVLALSAASFMTFLLLLRLSPEREPLALGVLGSFLVCAPAYAALGVLSWPTRTRQDDRLRLTSAAAAGRCSNAVADPSTIGQLDWIWRRRIGNDLAATADAFARRHRKRWLAPASASPLNLITKDLGKAGARAIRSLIERALTTEDPAALRDDLWRLHLRVMAHDFTGVLALHHPGVSDRSRTSTGPLTPRQVLLALPVVITTVVAVVNLIWGTDTSVLDLWNGGPSNAVDTTIP